MEDIAHNNRANSSNYSGLSSDVSGEYGVDDFQGVRRNFLFRELAAALKSRPRVENLNP